MPIAAPLERKQFSLQDVAFSAEGPGSFRGLASTYEPDSQGDRVMPGAYAATLPKFLTDGFIGWAHDDATPVAFPTQAYEDQDGLWIEATFHSTPAAQQARQITLERLAAGKRAGLSIGFYVQKAQQGADNLRELHQLDLVEVSLVSVPANDNARVAAVKSADSPLPAPEEPPPPDADRCSHGTPWDAHAAAVLTTLAAATHEAQGLYIRALAQDALERKEGRILSASTRSLLQQCIDAEPGLAAAFGVLRQLLADTAPPAKGYRARLDIRRRELQFVGILEGETP